MSYSSYRCDCIFVIIKIGYRPSIVRHIIIDKSKSSNHSILFLWAIEWEYKLSDKNLKLGLDRIINKHNKRLK